MKILVVLSVLLGGYYFYFHNSEFKTDFYFNGDTYSHVKKARGGEITNHFYTVNGVGISEAQRFIQIIEIGDSIPKESWPKHLKSLFNRYKLTPLQGKQLELAGSLEIRGEWLKSYATSININGKDHMAFFIDSADEASRQSTATGKIAMVRDLKSIANSFN